jgi:hypothetical protein
MGIKSFIERVTGIDKIKEEAAAQAAESIRIAREAEAAAKEAEKLKAEAEAAAKKAEEEAEIAKLSPKERAIRKKEPWVGVIQTHVNKDNIRNGFFELDWNEYFIVQLKQEGYGVEGDPEEEIVDRWFRELCANVVVDGDFGGPLDVNTGVIDINSVKKKNQ